MATCWVTGQESAEAIVGDRTPPLSDWAAGNKPGKDPGRLTPPKG